METTVVAVMGQLYQFPNDIRIHIRNRNHNSPAAKENYLR